MTEAELRIALAPFVTDTWPISLLLVLYHEWEAGTPTAEIGKKCRVTKNAAVGKGGRLVAGGVLRGRGSPIPPRPDGPEAPRPLFGRPLPPGTRTIPPLASELAREDPP